MKTAARPGGGPAGENPTISVLLATRNREGSLRQSLSSLLAAVDRYESRVELVVVDNGSSDGTPEVVAEFFRAHSLQGRLVQVPEPGKARALNVGLRLARGDVVAFTDDDVLVPEGWLVAVREFASDWPQYAAATGPVRLPPEPLDPVVAQRVRLLRTLPLFDLGERPQETKHLYGCNMVVRREVLERLGGFDERLGPGASGLHEDGDLARRLRARGERILYWPRLVMYHTVDPARLSWEFFRALHHADARSRFVIDGNRGTVHAVRRWLGAAGVWLLWSLLRHQERRTRAYGRLVSHTEYLRLCWSTRSHSDR